MVARSPGWCRGFAWWLVGKRNNKNVVEINLMAAKKSQKHKISHLPGLEACQLSLNPFCKGCEVIIDRIKKSVRIIFWYPKLDKRRPKQCHKGELNKWLATRLPTHFWLGYIQGKIIFSLVFHQVFFYNQVTCNFQNMPPKTLSPIFKNLSPSSLAPQIPTSQLYWIVQPPWFGIVRMTPTHQNTIRSQSSESHFSGRKLYHLEIHGSWSCCILGESNIPSWSFTFFLAPANLFVVKKQETMVYNKSAKQKKKLRLPTTPYPEPKQIRPSLRL